MNLKPETLEKIDRLIPRYPQRRSAALPLLHLVQEDQGWISQEAMTWIAARLEVEPISIYEIATFYPMLRLKPLGKRHIKVCRTLSCALAGSHEVRELLRQHLIPGDAQVWETPDYTIEFVECLASCGTAPVVQVDEVLHERITPDKAQELALSLLRETPPSCPGTPSATQGNHS